MENDLIIIIEHLLASEDNTGCSEDLTVVSVEHIEQLREYMRHYELGGGGMPNRRFIRIIK